MIPIKLSKDVARQINRLMQLNTEKLSEKEALQVPDLFEEWQENKEYEVDKIIKYGETDGITQLYKVVQKHVSQENWLPSEEKALYKNVAFKDGYDIWVQPLGATDAYQTGDIVSHEDVLYISTIDSNIWGPMVHGWKVKED